MQAVRLPPHLLVPEQGPPSSRRLSKILVYVHVTLRLEESARELCYEKLTR